ncbi:sigma-70 family RNA polymerase sigma factor [Streptomyces sp. JJ36]|nr:sigma-70 family RNA polymerase sigma factor [Streptomyces sp. JJ36]
MPRGLGALLTAECAAEAHGTRLDAEDLRQGVWLRWLERHRVAGPPDAPADWLRAAVRAEARPERRRTRWEVPLGGASGAPAVLPRPVTAADGHGDPASPAEEPLLAAERRRTLRAAVARLPGRCPAVLGAMLHESDRTYREIADELGISQGSLGPLRSRCLACLRRMLWTEVAAPELRGRVR